MLYCELLTNTTEEVGLHEFHRPIQIVQAAVHALTLAVLDQRLEERAVWLDTDAGPSKVFFQKLSIAGGHPVGGAGIEKETAAQTAQQLKRNPILAEL